MKLRAIYFSYLALLFLTAPVLAQSVAQNVLDELQISKSNYTGIIKIKLLVPARYISHNPLKSGKEIHIKIDLLSRGIKRKVKEVLSRESLMPQGEQNFSLEEVMFERVLRDDYIILYFTNDVSFEIYQDSSYRSISILIYDVK